MQHLSFFFFSLLNALYVQSPVGGDKIYFEMLEIQPIKVSITFVRSNERGTASATEIIKSDLVRIVVDVLSNALANIENAPIALNGKSFFNCYYSQAEY